MTNISIFLSGRGSSFEAMSSAIDEGRLDANIVLVASNKENSVGLNIAERMGFKTAVFDRKAYQDGKLFADDMLKVLNEHETDFIILAGYLRKIPPRVLRAFHNRTTNIHPALLPDFGGKGMYGMNVHQAVIKSGAVESGVTIHYVNEEYDEGEIIDQTRIPVLPGESPHELAARVLKVEHRFYSEVLQELFRKIKEQI